MTLKVRGVEGAMWVYLGSAGACAQSRSRVWLFAIPWTIARKTPLSMGFSKQDYWSGLPYPPPGDLLNPGMEPRSPGSSELAGRFLTPEPPGKPSGICKFHIKGLAQLPSWRPHPRLSSHALPTDRRCSAHSLTPLRWPLPDHSSSDCLPELSPWSVDIPSLHPGEKNCISNASRLQGLYQPVSERLPSSRVQSSPQTWPRQEQPGDQVSDPNYEQTSNFAMGEGPEEGSVSHR